MVVRDAGLNSKNGIICHKDLAFIDVTRMDVRIWPLCK